MFNPRQNHTIWSSCWLALLNYASIVSHLPFDYTNNKPYWGFLLLFILDAFFWFGFVIPCKDWNMFIRHNMMMSLMWAILYFSFINPPLFQDGLATPGPLIIAIVIILCIDFEQYMDDKNRRPYPK